MPYLRCVIELHSMTLVTLRERINDVQLNSFSRCKVEASGFQQGEPLSEDLLLVTLTRESSVST